MFLLNVIVNFINKEPETPISFECHCRFGLFAEQKSKFYLEKESQYLYKGSWCVFVIPSLFYSYGLSLIFCPPLSVLPYQSLPHHISVHLPRSSSFNLSLAHFCLYLQPSVHLLLIKSLFNLWANIVSQTVSEACKPHKATQRGTQIQFIFVKKPTLSNLERPPLSYKRDEGIEE